MCLLGNKDNNRCLRDTKCSQSKEKKEKNRLSIQNQKSAAFTKNKTGCAPWLAECIVCNGYQIVMEKYVIYFKK